MHTYARPPGERLLTVDEVARLPEEDDARVELVRGRLARERLPGYERGDIGGEILRRLANFVVENGLGRVVGETGFVLSEDPPTVRASDVAFVAAARIPTGRRPTGSWPGAPDLAVEVRAPSNRRAQIREKVVDYLEAGCRLVWVVDPSTRTVTVYRPDAGTRVVGGNAVLDGEDVVPGFRLAVAELFTG
ncbi:MAG TPA: Uma2 family endonuclease [Longimicrobiales bacterium]